MPQKKSSRNESIQLETKKEEPKDKSVRLLPKWFRFVSLLASLFFIIWIAIGIFIAIIFVQGMRNGAFSGVLGGRPAPQAQDQTTPAQQEATISGIGKVNVACVQGALSDESIQKLLEARDVNVLQGEEKTNFEKCIIAKASPVPTVSPSPAQ